MIKIVDNKIWKDGEKVGWIDGHHVRAQDGTKLGYCQDNFVYNDAAHKLAYIHENELVMQNGESSTPLEKINEEVEGEYPILMKCTVWVLLQD
jgi:hypothetical protein